MSVPVPDSMILRLAAEAIRTADRDQLRRTVAAGARCAPRTVGRPPDTYTVRIRHPDTWHPAPSATARPALRICRRCPVVEECGLLALVLGRRDADHGVWGGLTRTARRRLLRTLAPYTTAARPRPPGSMTLVSFHDCYEMKLKS